MFNKGISGFNRSCLFPLTLLHTFIQGKCEIKQRLHRFSDFQVTDSKTSSKILIHISSLSTTAELKTTSNKLLHTSKESEAVPGEGADSEICLMSILVTKGVKCGTHSLPTETFRKCDTTGSFPKEPIRKAFIASSFSK